jgi:hypothetical protein
MSFSNQPFPFSQSLKMTGAIALATAALVLPACSNEPVAEEPGVNDTEVSQATENNVTTEDLSDDLSNYLGQTVTVREEAEEVIDESAFLMNEDQLFGGEEILVINASGEPLYLAEGDDTDVQVTGEVREFVLADIEREFGLTLDPDRYVDYEQQPVIIAQSLALAPDPEDLTDNPELYYGKRIAVNAEVEELWAADLMSVDGDALFGNDDLLVINPNATLDFTEDEEVVMTGVLRPFVTSEIEQEYELTWDLDLQRQIEAEYQEKPVFVADEVYPSAL